MSKHPHGSRWTRTAPGAQAYPEGAATGRSLRQQCDRGPQLARPTAEDRPTAERNAPIHAATGTAIGSTMGVVTGPPPPAPGPGRPAMIKRGQPPDARAIARLRRWYARSIGARWSVRDVVHAWTLRVPPNVWNLGWPPTDAEIAAHPGRYLIQTDGTAWGPHDLAIARAGLGAALADSHGLVPSEVGSGAFFFGPPIGELVRCSWTFAAYGAEERHRLASRAADSADEALSRLAYAIGIESMRLASAHVGKRKGVSPQTGRRYRKGVGTARLARALLIWGLIEAGLSHRAAIRRWLGWEIALDGPLADSVVVRDAAELAASDTDPDALREFEESQRGANEQFWVAMGIGR